MCVSILVTILYPMPMEMREKHKRVVSRLFEESEGCTAEWVHEMKLRSMIEPSGLVADGFRNTLNL